LGEASNVRLVQRGVNLVEDAEWAGRVLEDSDQQCQRSQRLLATGKQQYVLQALARRRGHHVNSALGAVFFVGKLHNGVAAAKQLLEGGLEVLINLCERFLELLPRQL